METRRRFIVKGASLVAGGAAAAVVGPTRNARAATQLRILQQNHFVPAYDKWFDQWAEEWGAKRGLEVTVDHVGFADVVPRATAEVAAQSGHDLHMFVGLASAFEEHVIDLKDVQRRLEKEHGPQVELAKRSTSDVRVLFRRGLHCETRRRIERWIGLPGCHGSLLPAGDSIRADQERSENVGAEGADTVRNRRGPGGETPRGSSRDER